MEKRVLSATELEQVIGGNNNGGTKGVGTGPRCGSCGSTHTVSVKTDTSGRTEYKCQDCGYTFYLVSTAMFKA